MMLDPWSAGLSAWLLTYLLHSTLLTALAYGAARRLGRQRVALEEGLWRVAMLGGIVTATVQVAIGWHPIGAPWVLSPAISEPTPLAAPGVPGETALVASVAEGAVGSVTVGAEVAIAASSWPTVVFAAVVTLAVLGFCSVIVCSVRLHRRLAGRSRIVAGPAFELLEAIRVRCGFRRRVRLSSSDRVAVPVALGLVRAEICIPARGLDGLDRAQQESLLAHELAHLRAHDPLWTLIARVIERVLFVQPLNASVRRRLAELAEYRCDDWAIRQTTDSLALASCLVEVATWLPEGRHDHAASLLPAMAAEPSRLENRVRRILADDGPQRPMRLWPRTVPVALLCASTFALPTVSLAEHPAASDASTIERARGDATRSEQLGAMARQLSALAEIQHELTAEVAALRVALSGDADAQTWAPVLELLETRVRELRSECAQLREQFVQSYPERSNQRSHQ